MPSGLTRGLWWRGSSLTPSTAPRITTMTSLSSSSGHRSTSQVRHRPGTNRLRAVEGMGQALGRLRGELPSEFPPSAVNLNTVHRMSSAISWTSASPRLVQALLGTKVLALFAAGLQVGLASKSPAELLAALSTTDRPSPVPMPRRDMLHGFPDVFPSTLITTLTGR